MTLERNGSAGAWRLLRGLRSVAARIHALGGAVAGLEAALGGLTQRLEGYEARAAEVVRGLERGWEAQQEMLGQLRQDREELVGLLNANQRKTLEVLEVLRDAEPATRRLLWQVRERPGYEAAFSEPEPLVTVAIATHTQVDLLVERALPSVLAQTYERLEIVVVGDGAKPEVGAAVRGIGDPRIRYANLPYRGPYPDERRLFRMIAGAPASNEAMRLARGKWIAIMDDDDACTPNRVELLLRAARDRRWEFCYGRIRLHDWHDDSERIVCEFPPTGPGTVGLTSSLLHADLRFFTGELSDAMFETLGDWGRVRRMMRVGVRMGMIPDVVLDYYPSQLWDQP